MEGMFYLNDSVCYCLRHPVYTKGHLGLTVYLVSTFSWSAVFPVCSSIFFRLEIRVTHTHQPKASSVLRWTSLKSGLTHVLGASVPSIRPWPLFFNSSSPII